MSLETPRTPSAEQAPAEQELAELLRQKQELEMILESNRIALFKNAGAASHEQTRVTKETERLSQESIRAGLAGTSVDAEALDAAHEQQIVADEWATMAEEGRAQFEDLDMRDESNPLVQKLRSLGITENVGRATPWGHVADLVIDRLEQLEQEIRERKLEVPGGKEEVTIDALRATQLMSESHLEQIAHDLRYIVSPEGMRMSAGELIERAAGSSLNRYPLAVQKSALAQVFTQAADRIKNSRAEDVRKELPSFLEEVNRYLEQKSVPKTETA